MNEPAIAEARRLLLAGEVDAARQAAEGALAGATSPRDAAEAHAMLADCAQRGRDPAAGIGHARAALAAMPGEARYHFALAECLDAAGDFAGATTALARAVELRPDFAAAFRLLGILHAEHGNTAAADGHFRRALALDPKHARTWCNLGNVERDLGRLDSAENCYRHAVELQPDYPLAECNLAITQRDLGDAIGAEALLRQSLARTGPGRPFGPAEVALAGLLRQRGALEESVELYRRAIDRAPRDSAGERFSLAGALAECGDAQGARDAFASAVRQKPHDLRSALGMQLTLPMVYADTAEVERARAGYQDGLAQLERDLPAIIDGLTPREIIDGLRWSNFFLAYQGGDDLALQLRYAALAARAIDAAGPDWRAPIAAGPASGRRIRIGFASAFLHLGTVGMYFRDWIRRLDRDRFEVFFYHLRAGRDDVTASIAARADHFRPFAGNDARPSRVAPVIRSDALDVLVYPELGMDGTSFALSAMRLAPRQYAAWGHPVTTGHSTIDGYFTCAMMEPDDGDTHYAEPLIRLPGIGTCYERPHAAPVSRSALGLPETGPLLLCPQSLFKIHPDDDDLFARILAAHPKATLISFSEHHPALAERFLRRLERACTPHGVNPRQRIRMLPRVGHEDFLRINLACDLMLDTLHWSGGNTTLDALACGLPVVTFPGRFMRGRQSAGLLRLIDLPQLIAADPDDYVRIAARLAGDAGERAAIHDAILQRRAAIFDDPAPVSAFQAFVENAARAA